ncbi:hypothetical protein DB347_22210 [Opitutaceae bacterium EW11]|nr:hypothetical protein DB347_22210 [Opitutaceae bacterium EW11]
MHSPAKMDGRTPPRGWKPDVNALTVAGGYFVVAMAWIWGSDWLVNVVAQDNPKLSFALSTMKGSAFVIVTGIALYITVATLNARERRLASEKRLIEDMLSVAQRLEALGTLAGTLVHDFNNVLTVIRSQSELARLDGFTSSTVPEHLQAIDAATQRADQMVREIMQFMRQSTTVFTMGDLGQSVRETLAFLQNAVGRAIEIRLVVEDPLPRVPFERTQVERSLLNLALNARDAMERSSEKRITIQLRSLRFRGYRSLFRRDPVDGEFIALSVSDTGCGIDRSNFARVFSPFFTTKPPGKGMGLGLTSVLRVAEAHGGWVEVASEPGRGAQFTIYFPTETVARERALKQAALN